MGALRAGLLAWALLAALGVEAAHAQAPAAPQGTATTASSPLEATATPLGPEPIPLPDVAGRAESVSRRLAELRDRAEPDPLLTSIAEALPERVRRLERGAERTRQALGGPLSLERLADLERAWLHERDALGAWSAGVTARATELEALLGEVGELAEVWTLTARAAGEAPPALRAQLEATRREIREARRLLTDRRAAVLTLQAQMSERERAVDELLRDLETQRAELRSRVFDADSPPVWEAFRSLDDPALLVSQVRASVQRDLLPLRTFATDRPAVLTGQVLLFALLLALALLARRRLHHLPPDDPEVAAAGRVFERPGSAALLLTLVLLFVLGPRGPQALGHIAGMLLVIPALRLLPRVVDPSMRHPIYALVSFYGVNLVREILSAAPLLERVLYLAELAIALALLGWLLLPRRAAHLPSEIAYPRLLAASVRTMTALLAVALVANLLGYTVLAHVLGRGVFVAAYGFLVLFGAVRVLRAGLRVALRSRPAQRLRMVRAHGPLLLRRAGRIVEVLAVAAWAVLVLDGFELRQPLQRRIAAALDESIEVGAAAVSLGGLIAFGVTVIAAWALSRSIRFTLQEEVFPRLAMGRGVAHAASTTIHYVLLAAGFLLAIAAAGIDLDRFTLLAGALGVGIGFGLQNVVNNFVSGLILLYERPVQVGDTVEVGTLLGEVRRIGIRSSTVRTWQGAEVIVPNASLIADPVVNWTLSDRQRRVEIPVGVAYGNDPEKVLALLLQVARANPEILDDPAPLALFLGFGESSLDFELRAWSARFERAHITRSELSVAIHAALRDAGMEIPFPQRDLHVRSLPERPVRDGPDEPRER